MIMVDEIHQYTDLHMHFSTFWHIAMQITLTCADKTINLNENRLVGYPEVGFIRFKWLKRQTLNWQICRFASCSKCARDKAMQAYYRDQVVDIEKAFPIHSSN